MSFTSFSFIPFLALAAFFSYKLRIRARNALLLICSFLFYGLYGAEYLPFLSFSVLLTYFAARFIERSQGAGRRAWLAAALCLNLGMLFVFKYLGFFAASAERVFAALGMEAQLPEPGLILPVGISFFVFQTTGYLMDVYRGKYGAERSFVDYALFASFFPSLISGPISRADKMLPQYKAKNPFSYENIKSGALQFVWGAFKKMVIADRLAVLVNTAYAAPEEFTGFQLLFAALCYSVQIYCDFSAYSDMAIGAGRILGFRLPKNFDCPYLAVSMQDFWRRWHISLSTWFRDYLYFPLGGSRKGKQRGYLNVILVFLVSGLWHGAAATFVIWGLLHGGMQVLGKILKPYRDKLRGLLHIGEDGRLLHLFRILLTFAMVTAAWVFFRADSVSEALLVLGKIISEPFSFAAVTALGLSLRQLVVLLFAVLLLSFADFYGAGRLAKKINRSYAPRAAVYIALLCAIILFGHYGAGFDPMDFVYFKF